MVEIRSLHNEGLKNKQIAARLGIHRETVAKYLKTGEAPAEERGQARSRKADKYREYMGLLTHPWAGPGPRNRCLTSSTTIHLARGTGGPKMGSG